MPSRRHLFETWSLGSALDLNYENTGCRDYDLVPCDEEIVERKNPEDNFSGEYFGTVKYNPKMDELEITFENERDISSKLND